MIFAPRHNAHEAAPVAGGAAFAAAMAGAVPRVETARLTLRAPRVEDFGAFADLALGPRGRFFGGCERRDDAFYMFSLMAASWLLHGHGAWAVEDRAAEIVGFVLVGLEPGDREPELGFIVTETAEGRGIAFEAASAARDFAWERLRFQTLVSCIDPANARSIRLAERLGGQRDAAEEAAHGDGSLIYRYMKGGTA